MTTVKQALGKTDLQYLAESITDVEGEFGEMINNAFADFGQNTGYINLTDVPEDITDMIKEWLSTLEVTEYDD